MCEGNVTLLPSGVQVGRYSLSGVTVSRETGPSGNSMVQISKLSVSQLLKAIRLPSGERRKPDVLPGRKTKDSPERTGLIVPERVTQTNS